MGRARNTNASVQTTTRSTPLHPPGHPWRPSALQREYRVVLDLAREVPQFILDTDNEMLVIQRKDISDFQRELRNRVTQLARFSAVLAANHDRDPSEYAAQTDFPYLAAFDREEVAEFARDLLAATFDAAQRGTLEHLDGTLRGWESTASIYRNPEELAALTADISDEDLVEVFPPSEEQVAEAQAA
jgi:hypothetical protein